ALIAQGGAVLEVIDTGQPCFACMLGGEDGRTLFMLTAKNSNAGEAAAAPTGQLLIATVASPRAGWP
ncbi:MAG TPA: gluconolaconase, partial [Caulobacteraceae bacterium]